jgi:hypothetical protein
MLTCNLTSEENDNIPYDLIMWKHIADSTFVSLQSCSDRDLKLNTQ